MEGLLESLEKQAAEQAREHAHGEKESGRATDPAPPAGRQATAGNYAVQMGMMPQILPPGVQHGKEADLGAEMLGVGGDGGEGFGGGGEENAIDRPRVVEGQSGNLFGQSEHDMEILDRQQFGLPRFEPFCPLCVLTLGTMAVAAGVVADPGVVAMAALFDVAAQDGGAAGFDSPHDAQRLERQGVRGAVGFAVLSKNVSQLDGWPRHGNYCLGLRFGLGTSASNGLGVPATTWAPTRR